MIKFLKVFIISVFLSAAISSYANFGACSTNITMDQSGWLYSSLWQHVNFFIYVTDEDETLAQFNRSTSDQENSSDLCYDDQMIMVVFTNQDGQTESAWVSKDQNLSSRYQPVNLTFPDDFTPEF